MSTPATTPLYHATMAATVVGKDLYRTESSSTIDTSSTTEYHNRITSDGRIAASYEYSFSGPLGSTFTHEDYHGQWWIVDSGLSGGRYWAQVAVYWYDSTDAAAIGTVDSFVVSTADGVDFTIDGKFYASAAVADVAGAGNDTIDSSGTDTLGPTLLGKGGNDWLIGHDDHADQIFGGAGNDRLEGRGASDTLYGQEGNDTIDGGAGDDVVLLFSARDQFTFSSTGSGRYTVVGPEGTDQLIAVEYVQFGSAAPVAIGTLVGGGATDGADTLSGTDGPDRIDGLGGNDSLRGLGGNDTLIGGAGHDTLVGGTGADSMTGGAGDDAYVVDHSGDRTIEAAGGGSDRVSSGLTHTLAAEVEQLTLTGSAAIDGTGNASANRITGNGAANHLSGKGGNDTLVGNAGNDTLAGGGGADSMTGGGDDDAYVVDHGGDRTVEAAGGGNDRVSSSLTHTLAAEVEQLTLTGTGAIGGTGNASANRITGNDAGNGLVGKGGNDTLAGGAGNDTLNGGAGADSLGGGAGADVFVLASSAGSDTVTDFASGSDHLRVSQGALPIGDGDTTLDGARTRSAPGGFAPTAELVVFGSDIGGSITAGAAAAKIGSATGPYAIGARALFAVDNGGSSALYLFTAANADALVSATELSLLATLVGTPQLAVADLVFGA